MELEKLICALEAASSVGTYGGELMRLAAENLSELRDQCVVMDSRILELEQGSSNLRQSLRCERKCREWMTVHWLQGKTPKAEQQAIFRLGQKDMQASVIDMLLDTAAKMPANGMVGPTLRIAADMVKNMEVP